MSQDDSPSGAPDERHAAYEDARQHAEAAQEAVGDAEDDLVRAERARDRQDGNGDAAAGDDAAVHAAEEAWHDRRHEAHEASQARDRARDDLPG